MVKQFPEYDLYIAPDGTELRFGQNDRFVRTQDGYGMPPISYISQRGPFQHGETVIDYRLEPRTIQWVIRQNGCDRYDYWEKRADFLNKLRINRHAANQFGLGRLRKLLPTGSMRDIDVLIQFGPIFTDPESKWDQWGFTEAIRFYAPDPTFYDPVVGTLTWGLDPNQAHLVFPITFPIQFGYTVIDDTNTLNYAGTWLSFPTITISGPLSGFNLTNDDTGEKIHLNYAVKQGETVTINLEYGNKTVTSSVKGNIIGTVTTDSDLATFHIAPDPEAPGGVNNFSLQGASAGPATQVVLSYYTRYIGI